MRAEISFFKFRGFYARGEMNNRARVHIMHFSVTCPTIRTDRVLHFKARVRINPIHSFVFSLSLFLFLSLFKVPFVPRV